MSPKKTPQVPEESQQAAFEEPKEEVCEVQQRRGQYIAHVDYTEPPGRGRYAAHVDYTEPPGRGQYVTGVDNTETLEGIESSESERTTP